MSTIVTRAGKGSALTFAEVDANFTNLNTDKYQAGDTAALTALTLTTALAATSGGTGHASYTTGDLLYAASATSLAKLADVATGNALISGGVGVAPAWGKIGLTTHVTGTLPVANGGTGITSFGAGVATWLGTPSSANLAAAVTDETGTGALVFANTPTLVTPLLGTPTSGTLTNCTGLPISTGVSGLGTGVATFLATPTSANLAAAVTDETGSGALVFGTSPTISGATLGGTVTLSGGTANGVVYLNGSQAATTGTALTFNGTNLGVNIASPTLNFEVGGNNATAYLHSGVSVMSFGTKNNYPVSFDTNNTERMRLDTSGNLGIGTNAPGQRLTVQSASGDVTKFQSTNASGGYITVGSTTTAPLLMGYGSTLNAGATTSDAVLRANTGAWWLGTQGSSPIVLYTNGSEKLRIDSAGNLTVGGTLPTWFSTSNTKVLQLGTSASIWGLDASTSDRRLGISSNLYINASGNFIYAQTGEASLTYQNAGQHYWYNSPSGTGGTAATVTERMRLNSSGELCVATTTAAFSAANRGNITIGGTTSILSFRPNGVNSGYLFHDGTNFLFDNQVAGPIAFNTNTAERMRIASTGNIGMGTSSPQCLLHVAGQLNAVTQPTLGSYANSHFVVTQQAGLYGLNVGVSGNGDTWLQTQRFDMATAYNMQLNPAGGNVGIGTSAPAYKLDVRGAVNGGIVTYNQNSSAAGDAYSAFILGNDTVSGFAMFLNSSTRTGDGGTNTATIRNDAGSLYLKAKGDQGLLITTQTGTAGGNVKLGGTADRATTVGTNHIDIFNGTAPAGTLTNGISLYSSGGEAYVMDAAGNATLFSPHDSVTNEWIFRSKHTPTGKVLRIDVEKMLRFINDHFGLDMIQEFTEE